MASRWVTLRGNECRDGVRPGGCHADVQHGDGAEDPGASGAYATFDVNAERVVFHTHPAPAPLSCCFHAITFLFQP